MKKYRLSLSKDPQTVYVATVEVEAESAEKAEKIALEMAEKLDNGIEWELQDGALFSGEPLIQVEESEEVEDEE